MVYVLFLKLTEGGVWTFLGYGGTPVNLGDCCGLNLIAVFCCCWYAGGEIYWFCVWTLLPVGEP